MIANGFAFLLQEVAQQAPASGGPPPGGPFGALCGGQGGMMVPMVMIFGVFYFMLIRPQQKKQKELTDWLKTVKKGDEVVTSGGIVGSVFSTSDDSVMLEVADKVRVKVLRSHIAGKAPGAGEPAAKSTN